MKKIIVIGASGETGRYFVDYCVSNKLNEQFEIVPVGYRKTSFFKDYYNLDYISIDVSKQEDFNKLPQEDIFAVVDLAGYMPARSDGDYNRKMLDVNLIGTLNILDYCVKTKTDRILFAQSFGDIAQHANDNILLKPDMSRNFHFNTDHTVYLIAKCAAVDLIKYYHEHYGLKAFVFRLPTIYLYAKDRFFYRDGVKSTLWYRVLIDQACNGETMEIWGDPSRKKDMVYVKDFAQMLYLGILVERNWGVYNVGTGIGTSLEDQIKIMAEVLGPNDRKSEIIYMKEKPDSPQYIMDITAAKEELGYEPKYGYKEFLLDYVDEMKKGRFDDL